MSVGAVVAYIVVVVAVRAKQLHFAPAAALRRTPTPLSTPTHER